MNIDKKSKLIIAITKEGGIKYTLTCEEVKKLIMKEKEIEALRGMKMLRNQNQRKKRKITSQNAYLYDRDGNRDEKNIEFIVCHNGTVLSKNHSGFVVIEFQDPRISRKALCAPGHVEEIDVCSDPENPKVRFSWLKEDKNFKLPGSLLLNETHWMPLTAVLKPLHQLNRDEKDMLMPKYKNTIRQFEAIKIDPNPLYDLLEFYHIANNLMWSSNLGKEIYNTFIVFGNPKIEVCIAILTSQTYKLVKKSIVNLCTICNKNVTITHKIVINGLPSMNACVICLKRVAYLLLIRDFRASEKFEIHVANALVPRLKELLAGL
jgi:hypothetical protein